MTEFGVTDRDIDGMAYYESLEKVADMYFAAHQRLLDPRVVTVAEKLGVTMMDAAQAANSVGLSLNVPHLQRGAERLGLFLGRINPTTGEPETVSSETLVGAINDMSPTLGEAKACHEFSILGLLFSLHEKTTKKPNPVPFVQPDARFALLYVKFAKIDFSRAIAQF